jgi:hypothetical protein
MPTSFSQILEQTLKRGDVLKAELVQAMIDELRKQSIVSSNMAMMVNSSGRHIVALEAAETLLYQTTPDVDGTYPYIESLPNIYPAGLISDMNYTVPDTGALGSAAQNWCSSDAGPGDIEYVCNLASNSYIPVDTFITVTPINGLLFTSAYFERMAEGILPNDAPANASATVNLTNLFDANGNQRQLSCVNRMTLIPAGKLVLCKWWNPNGQSIIPGKGFWQMFVADPC